jgi:TolB-like protein/DNA-binding winged helix-turn-helix (wHTH) protein
MRTDFQLGDIRVRPQRDCIEAHGRTAHVTPKAMAVLERLARSAGEVVTRDELFDSVWPGGVVTDDALTQCIVELRKVLGDSARDPRFIETVPKVGFRLLPAVSPLPPPQSPATAMPFGSAWKPATQALFAVVSVALLGLVFWWYLGASRPVPRPPGADAPPSLAVLPFVDISDEQDQGWYAYGLTEELINRLAQLQGLQVTARTSSYHFANTKEDLRTIAAALGVNHLLEGSVRAEDETLRITAQLIDADTGFHLWSQRYDRPRDAIFSVQEEIADAVAGVLSVGLQVGDLGTMPGGTANVKAYEALMRSKVHQWEATPASMVQAIDLVKQAIDLDPQYARAWWRLAGLYVNANSIMHDAEGVDWLALSREALDRARELEPNLRGVKFMSATIQYVDRDWAGVEETMDGGAGLELTSDFDLLFAWAGFLHRVGRVHEALPIVERMHRINPYSPGATRALAWVNALHGRVEEGLDWAEKAYQLDGFKAWAVENGLRIALWSNDHQEIRKWLRRAEEHVPESRALFPAMAATLDDRLAALAWLRNAFGETQDHDFQIPFWAAWHGDPELALEAMLRLPVPWAFWGPEMRDVRRLPGFKGLLRQVGLEDYFREYGWNDFCRPLGEEDFECT